MRFIRWTLLIMTFIYGWIIRKQLTDPLMLGAFCLRCLLTLPLLAATSAYPLALMQSFAKKNDYCTAPVTYAFNEDAVLVMLSTKEAETLTASYSDFIALYETDEAFHLLHDRPDIILPKSEFTYDSMQKFRAFIEEKSGLTIQSYDKADHAAPHPEPTLSHSSVERLSEENGFKAEHLLTDKQYKKYLLLHTRRTVRSSQLILLVLAALLAALSFFDEDIHSAAFRSRAIQAAFFAVIAAFMPRLMAVLDGFLYKKRYSAPVWYLLTEEKIEIVFSDRFDSSDVVKYQELFDPVETDNAIYLLTNKKNLSVIVLPKDAMPMDVLSDLRAFIEEKTGKQIKVIQ